MRILAFVLSIIALVPAEGASEPDHLLPTDRSYNHAYFELLDRKLAKTPFDYGRIIVRPPFYWRGPRSRFTVRRRLMALRGITSR